MRLVAEAGIEPSPDCRRGNSRDDQRIPGRRLRRTSEGALGPAADVRREAWGPVADVRRGAWGRWRTSDGRLGDRRRTSDGALGTAVGPRRCFRPAVFVLQLIEVEHGVASDLQVAFQAIEGHANNVAMMNAAAAWRFADLNP